MLVNVDVFNSDENHWEVHSLLEIEIACMIYPFDASLEVITKSVADGYPEYTTTSCYKTFWDAEFEEHFTVEISKPLRITKYK